MRYVAYSFEAKSIQTYVLASSKLKDRIGASEQIESLCNNHDRSDSLLDQVLQKLKLQDHLQFSRSAGGAFVAIFPRTEESLQTARDFQAVWTYTVQQKMPSLRFGQGIGEGHSIKDAIKNAQRQQRINQQRQFPDLPLASPLAIFAPRSGRAASSKDKREENELIDAITQEKRALYKGKLLIEKVGDLNHEGLHWPREMPDADIPSNTKGKHIFPLLDADRTIAVLHADINNLGQMALQFIDALDDEANEQKSRYLEDARLFSDAIESIVGKAVNAACSVIAKEATNTFHTMPARPLVMAGDDITFILRGDVALAFTETLLLTLEEASKASTSLNDLRKRYPAANIPSCITACAGISFIKASQPLYQGYKLSESLCDLAKRRSKQHISSGHIVPSSVAFHRITTSMIEEYPVIVADELTTKDGRVLSMHPYFLSSDDDEALQPRFDDLMHLSEELSHLGKNQLRPLMHLLHLSESETEKTFKRWADVLNKTGKSHAREQVIRYLLALAEKDTEVRKDVGFKETLKYHEPRSGSSVYLTPLADAITITQITAKPSEES